MDNKERRISGEYLFERFQEIAAECTAWHDPAAVWQYAIATILGEISGYLFPVTQEEQAYWDEQEREARAWVAQANARRDTELLDPVPVVTYTV